MAHEDLFKLPKDIQKVSNSGPFYIRDNEGHSKGTYSPVVMTEVLVTCGGKDSKYWATRYARALNRTWNRISKEHNRFIQNLKFKE